MESHTVGCSWKEPTRNSMHESRMYYAEWKKPDFTCRNSREDKFNPQWKETDQQLSRWVVGWEQEIDYKGTRGNFTGCMEMSIPCLEWWVRRCIQLQLTEPYTWNGLILLYINSTSLEKEMATHSSILTWEFHGQRSLMGYSPWGLKESDTTKQLTQFYISKNGQTWEPHSLPLFLLPPQNFHSLVGITCPYTRGHEGFIWFVPW